MTRALGTVPQLVSALHADGWGDLAGAEHRALRITLDALADLGGASGRVVITARQLAQRTGYCVKWQRAALVALEQWGLIVWTRGHIEQGKPAPGWVKVVRSRLSQLVAHARQMKRWADAEHRAETTKRIKGTVRNATLWTRKHRRGAHNPLSVQGEVASTLPPYRGQRAGAQTVPPGTIADQEEEETMKHECIHGTPDVNACGMCRRELRLNPGMDVRTLWARVEERPTKEAQRLGLAAVRAALRQGKASQHALD